MTASIDELAIVPGIGEKTAGKMRWILDGPPVGAGRVRVDARKVL